MEYKYYSNFNINFTIIERITNGDKINGNTINVIIDYINEYNNISIVLFFPQK